MLTVLIQTDYINAANFTTDFEVPENICSYNASAQYYINFTDKSTPVPSASAWFFSDDNSTTIAADVSHAFNKDGNYEVKHINTYGTCIDTVSKTVRVNPSPFLTGFINDKDGTCSVPLTIQFQDTTNYPVRHWDFGTGNIADTSKDKTAKFTFTTPDKVYPVTLNCKKQGKL